MNSEKSIREIALALIGEGDGFEIRPGFTLIKTIGGFAMATDGTDAGVRDLDALTPGEISAIVARADAVKDGYFNPANSPLEDAGSRDKYFDPANCPIKD